MSETIEFLTPPVVEGINVTVDLRVGRFTVSDYGSYTAWLGAFRRGACVVDNGNVCMSLRRRPDGRWVGFVAQDQGDGHWSECNLDGASVNAFVERMRNVLGSPR